MTKGPAPAEAGAAGVTADGIGAGLADAVRRIAWWGRTIGGAALIAGLAGSAAGWTSLSRVCLLGGLGVVVAVPVVNVIAAFVEEVRRREWVFLAVAVAVLAILIYNVARAL